MSEGDSVHRFGPYRFDEADGTLLRDGAPLSLTPRTAALLAALLRHRGNVLTRAELERLVWGETYVDSNNLHQQIAALRRIVGGEWIETVPRRGYRFAVPVEEPQREPAPAPLPHRRRLIAAIAALSFGILASCILYYQQRRPAPSIRVDSIAVLPFKTLTPTATDDYLRLGLTDALISRLGSLGVAEVRPLSAVHGFGNLDSDAVTAGRRLHVDAVLDGTTQRSGDRVRLTLRLVEVATGRQLWSAIYDERIDDIFSVEDRISRAVVDVFSTRLEPLSPQKRRPSVDPYVVEAYLRGRYHFSRRTSPDFEKSIVELRRALDRDPSFAPAWAALGDSLNFTGRTPEAKNAIERALALDPALADARATLGNILFFHDRNLPAAEREFQRAIEMNPSCTNARHWYAYLLAVRGRMPEAMRELEAARRIDPLSLSINTSVGSLLYLQGRYDEAIAAYREVAELDPNFAQAELELGIAYAAKGDVARAREAMRRSGVTRIPSWDDPLTAYTLAIEGDRTEARKALKHAENTRSATTSGAYAIWLAATHVALGNKDAAIDWLQRAVGTADGNVMLIGIDPKFRPLHGDARFRELLKRASLG